MKWKETTNPPTRNNFEYKNDDFGKIFSPENIGKYSGKIKHICDQIIGSTGVVMIYSQYIDYQFRPLENLYATIGLRSDEHSVVGRKPSGRTTLAYKLDQKRKIRPAS